MRFESCLPFKFNKVKVMLFILLLAMGSLELLSVLRVHDINPRRMFKSLPDESYLDFIKNLSKFTQTKFNSSDAVIASFGEDSFANQWQLSLLNNVCYAVRHKLPFVYSSEHLRTEELKQKKLKSHHEKILLVQKLLKSHQYVLWIDLDAAILDKGETDIFTSIARQSDANLLMVDHSHSVNNGVFFLRQRPWTFEFLDQWIKDSIENPDVLFFDNGSMYMTILSELGKNCSKITKPVCQEYSHVSKCLQGTLKSCNWTYQNRERIGTGEISFLNSQKSQFRFNQWYFENYFGRQLFPYQEWNQNDYYREGDLVVHTKHMPHFFPYDKVPLQCQLVDNAVWREFRDSFSQFSPLPSWVPHT